MLIILAVPLGKEIWQRKALLWREEARVAAHILQGKEAAFIHYITAFSGDDFTVVSNQHDGLIIEGTIPMELIHNARRFSGLPYAELEEKSIH